jgi:hypothetical protein
MLIKLKQLRALTNNNGASVLSYETAATAEAHHIRNGTTLFANNLLYCFWVW